MNPCLSAACWHGSVLVNEPCATGESGEELSAGCRQTSSPSFACLCLQKLFARIISSVMDMMSEACSATTETITLESPYLLAAPHVLSTPGLFVTSATCGRQRSAGVSMASWTSSTSFDSLRTLDAVFRHLPSARRKRDQTRRINYPPYHGASRRHSPRCCSLEQQRNPPPRLCLAMSKVGRKSGFYGRLLTGRIRPRCYTAFCVRPSGIKNQSLWAARATERACRRPPVPEGAA
ncbi:uncharacterized protein B0I36DRAFT_7183 [Microdochium trichocladiopsis]|uniref:Uncharacterized protein n=1 Tax=Microdochium trichocladiopsis TaxID=1682393 RepID=A0A9P8YGZ9_9PEZI|nr:uncharacterized protein B0I36DRAFT_7183 [Microdochium trichocladiopsis]KAH7040219.1 hypothetical protein B0I36DRAFT_7183 [Microdochium trichocladiopsis]